MEYPSFRNNIQQCAIPPLADFPALQWLKIKLRTFSLQACWKQALSLAGEVTQHVGKMQNFPGTAAQMQIKSSAGPCKTQNHRM